MSDLNYDNDPYWIDPDPEPDLSVEDVAAAISFAVESRVAEHAAATQTQVSEFSVRAAEEALRAKYSDYDALRPAVEQKFTEAGYSPYQFTSPGEAETLLELFFRQAVDEENERRKPDPVAEWAKVREAHTPNPWTSS